MLTATYDLKRLDIFKHLNGDHYSVDSVEWIGGDNYAVTCIDNNDDLVTFNVDVHTMFDVVFTYKQEGTKLHTLVITLPNGTQVTETCSNADLQDDIDGMAHYYFKGRIDTFTVDGVAFDEAKYCAEQGI
jgi:hypothetical protein